MLRMEKCDSFQERVQPLLNTLPTKQEYLKQYIELINHYQSFINSANKHFMAYFVIHAICSIAFHLNIIAQVSSATVIQYLVVLPEILWVAAVIFFKKLLLVEDPHLMGQKRINIINAIKPTQLFSINFLIIAILLLVRSIFISKNYILLMIDFILILLAFRTLLQAYNKEKMGYSLLNYMRQQEFYLVPLVQARQMEEPFQIKNFGGDKSISFKDKSAVSPFKKYFKPAKRKESALYDEDEYECQLYSH